MSDVVVTVPAGIWEHWLAEGDCVGDSETGKEWSFWSYGNPCITKGERVYVVARKKLRGYAPLICVYRDKGEIAFVRGGDAVAVTIDKEIRGFRGWRYRWWERSVERSFLEWKNG